MTFTVTFSNLCQSVKSVDRNSLPFTFLLYLPDRFYYTIVPIETSVEKAD